MIPLSAKGMVLGLLDGADYPQEKLRLRHDDILVLYTDGVTEAENDREEAFGTNRLYDVVRGCKNRPARDILAAILSEVERFTGRTQFDDDVTVVVARLGAKS
ncbi:MAG: PP2C family protein-serine/threonine phosphatase [Candidatus Xenobia bacterium]